MAYTLVAKEIIWFCQLLCDLGEKQLKSIAIHGDNKNAITLVENPKFHSRFNHIELQFHFICIG
jgi:lactam utilization protein B